MNEQECHEKKERLEHSPIFYVDDKKRNKQGRIVCCNSLSTSLFLCWWNTWNRGHYRHLPLRGGALALCNRWKMEAKRAHHRPSKTVICPSNCNIFDRLLTIADRFQVETSKWSNAKCRARPLTPQRWPNVEQMVLRKNSTPFLTFYPRFFPPDSIVSLSWCRTGGQVKISRKSWPLLL